MHLPPPFIQVYVAVQIGDTWFKTFLNSEELRIWTLDRLTTENPAKVTRTTAVSKFVAILVWLYCSGSASVSLPWHLCTVLWEVGGGGTQLLSTLRIPWGEGCYPLCSVRHKKARSVMTSANRVLLIKKQWVSWNSFRLSPPMTKVCRVALNPQGSSGQKAF